MASFRCLEASFRCPMASFPSLDISFQCLDTFILSPDPKFYPYLCPIKQVPIMSKTKIVHKPKESRGVKEKLPNINNSSDSSNRLTIILGIFVFLFAFLLYAQSISFGFVYDDHTVLNENKVVMQGFKGISTILKTDRLYGFKPEYRTPEYRPVPLILFAIEWNFFPGNPKFFHLINILLYAITCWLLFLLLVRLFKNQIFPFVCMLLYAAHPIHTEVVANIKSVDEILCFLFAIISILFVFKSLEKNFILNIIIASVSYFLSLASKETGISFLVIIPLLIYVFTNTSLKKILTITSLLGLSTIIFLLIRFSILSGFHDKGFINQLNNSLVTAPDFISQKVTTFFILFKYILLLIIPHPLTHDYSFSQIKTHTLSDPISIISLAVYLALGIYAIIKIKDKNIISFAILFYLITLSPVSNLFLLIGATMAERFMYIPSFGFCILITYLLIKFTKSDRVKKKISNLKEFTSSNSTVIIITFIIVGLYSIKTFSRSSDWKDNATLFSKDVEISDSSARAHYSLGYNLLVEQYPLEKVKTKQAELLNKAIKEFSTAITIMPNYVDAYENLALAYQDKPDFNNAIKNYELSRKYNPNPPLNLLGNLADLYTKTGQPDKSLTIIDTALIRFPNDAKLLNNKGKIYFEKHQYEEAMKWFKESLKTDAQNPNALKNIGSCYGALKDYENAILYFNKSLEFEKNKDNIANTYQFIGMSYKSLKNEEQAAIYLKKAKEVSATSSNK